MQTVAEAYRIAGGGLADYMRRSSAVEFVGQAVSASDWGRNSLLEEISRQRETLLSAARDALDVSSFVREPTQVSRDCHAAAEHIGQADSDWSLLETSAVRKLSVNGSDELAAVRQSCSEAIQADLSSTQALLCTAADALNCQSISQEAVSSGCCQEAIRALSQQETIAKVLSASENMAAHARNLWSPDPFSLSQAYRQFNERELISEVLRSHASYGAERLWLDAQTAQITEPVSSDASIRSRVFPANERLDASTEAPWVRDAGALRENAPPTQSELDETSEAYLPLPQDGLELRAIQIVSLLWEAFELADVALPADGSLLQEALDLLALELIAHYDSHELEIRIHVDRVGLALSVLFCPPGPVTSGRTEALTTDDYEIAEEACASLLALIRRLKRC
jgi:hypothetical protein